MSRVSRHLRACRLRLFARVDMPIQNTQGQTPSIIRLSRRSAHADPTAPKVSSFGESSQKGHMARLLSKVPTKRNEPRQLPRGQTILTPRFPGSQSLQYQDQQATSIVADGEVPSGPPKGGISGAVWGGIVICCQLLVRRRQTATRASPHRHARPRVASGSPPVAT